MRNDEFTAGAQLLNCGLPHSLYPRDTYLQALVFNRPGIRIDIRPHQHTPALKSMNQGETASLTIGIISILIAILVAFNAAGCIARCIRNVGFSALSGPSPQVPIRCGLHRQRRNRAHELPLPLTMSPVEPMSGMEVYWLMESVQVSVVRWMAQRR